MPDPPSFFSKVSSEIGNWSKMFSETSTGIGSWFKSSKAKQTSISPKKKKYKQSSGSGALPFLPGSDPLSRTGIYAKND